MLEKRSMSVLDEAALEELQRVLLCNLAPSGSNSSSSSENNHHHYHHSAESNHIRNQSINILEEESRLIEQFREDLSGQGYRFPQCDFWPNPFAAAAALNISHFINFMQFTPFFPMHSMPRLLIADCQLRNRLFVYKLLSSVQKILSLQPNAALP
ncbi:MAG: hypothetical protein MHMPM18_002872 [Marteilia pararefringens]